jgi:hypothetical protein
VKHIHDHEGSAVEQNDVASDYDVLALRRWRRQAPLEVLRATHNLFLQSGGQRATHHQLALESGRQAIALGQAGRQMIVVIAVPAAHLVAVVVGIGVAAVLLIFVMAFAVAMAMVIVIVAILFIVAVPVVLG